MMTAHPDLVLASASPYRSRMLRDAGLEIEAVRADVDERAAEQPLAEAGADPADIASVLAQVKAQEVSARRPGAVVIGCDQTLGLDGEVLHKPADMEEAIQRLLALSGRTHQLNSAICLVRDGELLWSHLETCNVTFRRLDPGFVGRHLAAVGEKALTSVGAYQVEGHGAQLIEKIDGDFFSVVGLPLLPLLGQLRKMSLIDS